MSMLRSSLRGALFTVACVAYAASAKAQCEITGPTVICPDSSVTLCAPNAPGYRWADTEGNVMSTNQCITVLSPGTYRVYTYDAGLDMWWGCSHTVSIAPAESCFVEPPPPPRVDPTPDTLACPRPASWWAKQCRREGDRRTLLDAAELQAVGDFVDQRSELFSFEASNGFCRVVRHSDISDLRTRTHRQFAAVLANLCASGASMTRRDGRLFGLGEGTVFRTFFGSTTVGEWVDATDQELVQLRGASLKDKAARAAYRRLFGEAWAIGHGVGLQLDCPMGPVATDGEDASVMAALGPDADLAEPLAAVAMPNPFHGSTRFAFTVPDASGAEVDMSVFDVAGRRVASLARGRYPAGSHVVQWDGRGLDGSRARAGMYFLRGRIGNVDVMTSVMKVE